MAARNSRGRWIDFGATARIDRSMDGDCGKRRRICKKGSRYDQWDRQPFVGLLGDRICIMNAFIVIAEQQNNNLCSSRTAIWRRCFMTALAGGDPCQGLL
jgi:biopolymer transport protein TolQ